MTLSDEELARYARHIVLPQVGGVGQNKLKASRVAVIGAGGIGSAVIPALAGAGIGGLTVIDADIVDSGILVREELCVAEVNPARLDARTVADSRTDADFRREQ